MQAYKIFDASFLWSGDKSSSYRLLSFEFHCALKFRILVRGNAAMMSNNFLEEFVYTAFDVRAVENLGPWISHQALKDLSFLMCMLLK